MLGLWPPLAQACGPRRDCPWLRQPLGLRQPLQRPLSRSVARQWRQLQPPAGAGLQSGALGRGLPPLPPKRPLQRRRRGQASKQVTRASAEFDALVPLVSSAPAAPLLRGRRRAELRVRHVVVRTDTLWPPSHPSTPRRAWTS